MELSQKIPVTAKPEEIQMMNNRIPLSCIKNNATSQFGGKENETGCVSKKYHS